jgi:hypothetical protein
MKRICCFSLLVCCAIIFSGCKDDEKPAVPEIKIGENKYSLKDAKLYLRIEGSYEGAVNYTYRDYLISDGDLIEGQSGWSMLGYTNATYFIAFELATPEPNVPTVGSFPLHRFWDDVTDGSNLSYFFAEFEGMTYDTHDTDLHPAIVTTGGGEPGEKMTIQFSGEIAHRYFINSGETVVFDPYDSKLDFTGTVIDKRD